MEIQRLRTEMEQLNQLLNDHLRVSSEQATRIERRVDRLEKAKEMKTKMFVSFLLIYTAETHCSLIINSECWTHDGRHSRHRTATALLKVTSTESILLFKTRL